MSIFKFSDNDIFYSKIKTYPKNSFFLYEGVRIYNDTKHVSGNFSGDINLVPSGYLSLYELNVDRDESKDTYNADTDTGNKNLIRPFVYKTNNSYQSVFKYIPSSSFFNKSYVKNNAGQTQVPIITGSYPMSASIRATHYPANSDRPHVQSLKNICGNYRLSTHYEYFSNLHNRDFDSAEMMVLEVPSIFYGETIKKGSVSLKFFISGTLTAELSDKNRNGELIQVGPENSSNYGHTCGIIFYNEGVMFLTSSANLNTLHTENYLGVVTSPKWIYFGSNILNSWNSTPSSSYHVEFNGTETIPTVTMLAHAKKNELNYSNNLTAIQTGSIVSPSVTKDSFIEDGKRLSKNMVSSSFDNTTGSFERRTYISGIKIFDEDKKLIGVAKLATPTLKKPNRDITFKLKYDF